MRSSHAPMRPASSAAVVPWVSDGRSANRQTPSQMASLATCASTPHASKICSTCWSPIPSSGAAARSRSVKCRRAEARKSARFREWIRGVAPVSCPTAFSIKRKTGSQRGIRPAVSAGGKNVAGLAVVITAVIVIWVGLWSLIPWWVVLFFCVWGVLKAIDSKDE